MYRISELAEKVGLSRSTLLYYEKLGLLHGVRQTNGYRLYSDKDVQHLHLLDEDIAQKQRARELLAALLGQGSLRLWHQQTDKLAPDAHLDWLKRQGFNEQQALHLKWLSKDMNEHDQYMTDFMTVFQRLERWGPSSDADSLKALSTLPTIPTKIIDIGCGKGFSTRLLAQHTKAQIVAVDNEQSALDELDERLTKQGLGDRVTLSCTSMTDLPFTSKSFDCIWSEAATYIMGVEQALTQWRKLLTDSGYMVISDLIWLTDNPSQEAVAFWASEYPDMQTIEKRLGQMRQADFAVIDHFTLSEQAWHDYYQPLKAQVADVKASMPSSNAIIDIEREIAIYERYLGEFGYQMFVLRKGA